MDLYDALTDAEAASTDVARQHADLVAQVEAKQAELDDLQLEIKGLKKAIARYERRLTSAREVVHDAAGSEERPPVTDGQTPTTRETVQPQASGPSEDQQPSATDGQTDGDWRKLHRTEAVARMLAKAGEPISPSNLSRMLKEVGRDDDGPLEVGKALNHLQKKHRATTVERARWVPVHDLYDPRGVPPITGGTQEDEQEKGVTDDQEVNGAAPTLTGGERWS
jgi:hypothetical protein